jgi:hypothetical protein
VTSPDLPPQTFVFVLVSYRLDEPAGVARTVAATSAGLRQLGHRALTVTAVPQLFPDPDVIELTQLPVTFPCDHRALRQAIRSSRSVLTSELTAILYRCQASTVIYAGPLQGLGCLAPSVSHPARPVLAVHDLASRADLTAALAAAGRVVTPSAAIIAQASQRGYDTTRWRVVPSALLADPGDVPHADPAEREELRLYGPIRAVARLSASNGISSLLRTGAPDGRAFQLALSAACLETSPGSQRELRECCQALAWRGGAEIRPPLTWLQVPAFLARAAVTVIPSQGTAFGTVALESLSAGTPVVGYHAGGLPDLLCHDGLPSAGVLVRPGAGPRGFWHAVRQLLADPDHYHQASQAAYDRSRHHLAARAASLFIENTS